MGNVLRPSTAAAYGAPYDGYPGTLGTPAPMYGGPAVPGGIIPGTGYVDPAYGSPVRTGGLTSGLGGLLGRRTPVGYNSAFPPRTPGIPAVIPGTPPPGGFIGGPVPIGAGRLSPFAPPPCAPYTPYGGGISGLGLDPYQSGVTGGRFGRGGLTSLLPLLCGPCLLCLALILSGIALGIPIWSSGNQTINNVGVNRQVGLFDMCGFVVGGVGGDNCQSTSTALAACPDLLAKINVVKGLLIAALVILLLAACCLGLTCCLTTGAIALAIPCCGAFLALVALALLIAALVIWVSDVLNGSYPQCTDPSLNGVLLGNSQLCPGCGLGAGWILGIIAAVLTLLALCCTCLYCCFRQRRAGAAIPGAPYIDACPSTPVAVLGGPCGSPVRPVYRMNHGIHAC